MIINSEVKKNTRTWGEAAFGQVVFIHGKGHFMKVSKILYDEDEENEYNALDLCDGRPSFIRTDQEVLIYPKAYVTLGAPE